MCVCVGRGSLQKVKDDGDMTMPLRHVHVGGEIKREKLKGFV